MLTTSLDLLHEHGACVDRYALLRKALGKDWPKKKPIPLQIILEINGLDDALWALRAVPEEQYAERDRISRIFACRCTRETPLADGRKTWDLLDDPRSRRAVEVAEEFAEGRSNQKKLDAAWAAAWDAARDAAWAAAGDAAWAAAGAAAWAAARAAAGGAARAAAWDAAWAAAWAAARAAQRKIFLELISGNQVCAAVNPLFSLPPAPEGHAG